MKVLFMGTPDFAVFSLKSLIESGHNICGVITQPDKPKGRGYTLTPPPVKVTAIEANIAITTSGFTFKNSSSSIFPPPNLYLPSLIYLLLNLSLPLQI